MDLQNTVASQFAEGGPIPPPINSNGFDINAGISERDLKIAGRGRSFFFKKTTDRVGNTRSANALNYQQGNMYNSMTTQYDKGGKIKKHKPQIV
jgi:hypothetical protein